MFAEGLIYDMEPSDLKPHALETNSAVYIFKFVSS